MTGILTVDAHAHPLCKCLDNFGLRAILHEIQRVGFETKRKKKQKKNSWMDEGFEPMTHSLGLSILTTELTCRFDMRIAWVHG